METIWVSYIDAAGEHRWRAIDKANHRTLFGTSEGYTKREGAKHCAFRSGWTKGESLT